MRYERGLSQANAACRTKTLLRDSASGVRAGAPARARSPRPTKPLPAPRLSVEPRDGTGPWVAGAIVPSARRPQRNSPLYSYIPGHRAAQLSAEFLPGTAQRSGVSSQAGCPQCGEMSDRTPLLVPDLMRVQSLLLSPLAGTTRRTPPASCTLWRCAASFGCSVVCTPPQPPSPRSGS